MPPSRLLSSMGFGATLLLAGAASAQTANGSPTDPAPPGLVGTPRPVSRTAPSTGVRRAASDAPAAAAAKPPRLTAAERAEKRKLDHDLRICIGC